MLITTNHGYAHKLYQVCISLTLASPDITGCYFSTFYKINNDFKLTSEKSKQNDDFVSVLPFAYKASLACDYAGSLGINYTSR